MILQTLFNVGGLGNLGVTSMLGQSSLDGLLPVESWGYFDARP